MLGLTIYGEGSSKGALECWREDDGEVRLCVHGLTDNGDTFQLDFGDLTAQDIDFLCEYLQRDRECVHRDGAAIHYGDTRVEIV